MAGNRILASQIMAPGATYGIPVSYDHTDAYSFMYVSPVPVTNPIVAHLSPANASHSYYPFASHLANDFCRVSLAAATATVVGQDHIVVSDMFLYVHNQSTATQIINFTTERR